jgi:hypothetical protein
MARDTSAGTVTAFLARKSKRGGGCVKITGDRCAFNRYESTGDKLRVWGNVVAEWRNGRIRVCDAGWRTKITKGIINAILQQAGSRCSVYQERGDWKVGCRPPSGEGSWRKTDWPGCLTFKPKGSAFGRARRR